MSDETQTTEQDSIFVDRLTAEELEGRAIEPFDLEEHDREVRENLLKTILQYHHTLIDEEGMEYLVVDVLDIEDVCDMYDFLDGDEFKDFLYGE